MSEAVREIGSDSEVREAATDFTDEVASLLVGAAQDASEELPEETEGETSVDDSGEETANGVVELEIPEMPEELAREMAEAEIDLEVDSQPAVEEDASEDYYDDGSELQQMRKELAKAKKREAFLEEQNVKSGTPGWRADAEKYFPLSAAGLDDIKATSKRDYLRQAKARHESILPMYESMKAAFAESNKAKDAKMRAEIRSELEGAWGKPTSIPSELPDPPSDSREKIQSVRRKRSLAETIKTRLG